ncbi:MAG: hypothetical protein AAF526_06490 [Pseudomonadota bacterium]
MGREDQTGFVHLARNDLPLKDCGFDGFELAVLEVSRRFFAAFAHPEEHGWMDAFEQAEQMFPPPFGATLALAVSRTIRVLRSTRTTPFEYAHPSCQFCDKIITQEERYLISILRAVRKERASEAVTHALLVCEGGEPERLVAAFEALCVIIGEGPLASKPRP